MTKCPICLSKTSFFHRINKYQYYICANCKTLFLFPQPKSKDLEKYYQKTFSFDNGLINEENIRKRAKTVLIQLKKLNPNGKTLLDIGSGYGFFLDEAQKTGIIVTGLEPSEKLYSYSKKFNYLNNRIFIIGQTFNLFFKKSLKVKYDFISAIHVIEHLNHPKAFLKQVSSLLNKDGILYIETPNFDSHLFNSEKQNYIFLTPPDHLWIFSKKTIEYMLSEGYQIIKCSTYSYPSHFMGVIRKSKTQSSNIKSILKIQNSRPQMLKQIKYLIFDQFLARILTPILNIDGKGSILELYIKKKN